MLTFIVILLYTQSVQGDTECGIVSYYGAHSLIIGGNLAKRGEVPWHAAIYTKTTIPYKQICGGSLVSNSIVISAAHCFWDNEGNQAPDENYAVGVGKLYRPWNTYFTKEMHQRSDVQAVYLPVRYRGSETNQQEDIAIVAVTTPFQYTTFVRPVCIDFDINLERKQLQPGKHGKVAGWGLTDENGVASQILKVIQLPYVDTKTCINESPYTFRPYITSDKFCAGYRNATLALCEGDSGGGLVFPETVDGQTRYYLRGIVSSAPSGDSRCNANAYTCFTQLLKHEYFIKLFWSSATTSTDNHVGCKPIPPTLTSKKTGQKAWDKCIEYQQKLVFPCGSKTTTDGQDRTDRCDNSAVIIYPDQLEAAKHEFRCGSNTTAERLERIDRCHNNAYALYPDQHEAAKHEFPHMALLRYEDDKTTLKWSCGGSLISEHFILTAAHCVISHDIGLEARIYVTLGILKRDEVFDDHSRYKAKQIYVHPQYKRFIKYHDIALLELDRTVPLSEFLVPACLHTGDEIDDTLAAVTGWGAKYERGPMSNELKKMILTKYSTEKCAEKYPPYPTIVNGIDPNTQTCYAKVPTSTDACDGDSGGPLQVRNSKIACMYTIIGVTSFGRLCGNEDMPGIYTTISYYLPWIESIVWP